MTTEDLIAKWKTEIANWDVKNLKADDEFMADSMNYPEFCAHVISVKPEMQGKKRHRPVFLGLNPPSVGSAEKTPQIEAQEPVEKISRTAQIYADVIAFRDRKKFL